MKVSSITVTLNESNNIRECLESVSWCDEHIIIDEFSDDDTKQIAESMGATVYQVETPEDSNSFDILRKYAIEKASHDWLLRIDADERSHKKLNNQLKALTGSSGVDIVQVPRMTFIDDDWVKTGGRWWPDRSPVLFHKDALEIRDEIHTHMNPLEDANTVLLPAEPDSSLRHYSYSCIYDLIRRRWRYAQIEAERYESPFYVPLYEAIRCLIKGIIIDSGFKRGGIGLLVPIIDSLYLIFIMFLSNFNDH